MQRTEAAVRRGALRIVVGLLVLAGNALGAGAQGQGSVQVPVPPDSQNEIPAPALPGNPLPGRLQPPAVTGSSSDLARSGGVIRPPANVDPDMKQPTPNPGAQSMPVIPPPGTPGGNPDIVPK